jgi:hypothetical protein
VPVAIYTRVSTANQVGGRFDSCESQSAVCRDFIAKHASDGWFEVACFSDPAYSGSSMNRPGIRALMRQIEAGEVKIVLIFKLERVLRSTDEWGPFRTFLQKHGCRLVSPTEDLSDETPSGRLKNNLLKGVAFCGNCGRAMIPNASGKLDPDGKPYRYYTCGHASAADRERSSQRCCQTGRFRRSLRKSDRPYLGRAGDKRRLHAYPSASPVAAETIPGWTGFLTPRSSAHR